MGFCWEWLHQHSKKPFHSSEESLILFMPWQEGWLPVARAGKCQRGPYLICGLCCHTLSCSTRSRTDSTGHLCCLSCWLLPSRYWGVSTLSFRAGLATPALSWGPGREREWIRWPCPMAVAARPYPESQQLWKVGGGLRLSVTHVINYFLTISSVSAS